MGGADGGAGRGIGVQRGIGVVQMREQQAGGEAAGKGERVGNQGMGHGRASAEFVRAVKRGIHQGHIREPEPAIRLRPQWPGVNIRHVQQGLSRTAHEEGQRPRAHLIPVRHGQGCDGQVGGQGDRLVGNERVQAQVLPQRLPQGRLPQQFQQGGGGVEGEVAREHAFGAKLRQAADVPHVRVGEEDGVGLAQTVGARGVGTEPGGQGIDLVFDVGGGVDEPDAGGCLAGVDQGQAGGVFVTPGAAVGAKAGDMGHAGILHHPQHQRKHTPHHSARPKIIVALCPPMPNPLDITMRSDDGRAVLGT